MLLATVYGGPVGVSDDAGETWKFMDKAGQHVDWCAVDWTDPAQEVRPGAEARIGRHADRLARRRQDLHGGRQGLRPGVGLRRPHRRRRRDEDEGAAEAAPAAHRRRRQEIRRGRRAHRDGAAEVARRHAVLAGRWGAAGHDRQGQELEEAVGGEGRPLRAGLRQGRQAALRADERRHRRERRRRGHLGQAAGAAERGQGRLAA